MFGFFRHYYFLHYPGVLVMDISPLGFRSEVTVRSSFSLPLPLSPIRLVCLGHLTEIFASFFIEPYLKDLLFRIDIFSDIVDRVDKHHFYIY